MDLTISSSNIDNKDYYVSPGQVRHTLETIELLNNKYRYFEVWMRNQWDGAIGFFNNRNYTSVGYSNEPNTYAQNDCAYILYNHGLGDTGIYLRRDIGSTGFRREVDKGYNNSFQENRIYVWINRTSLKICNSKETTNFLTLNFTDYPLPQKMYLSYLCWNNGTNITSYITSTNWTNTDKRQMSLTDPAVSFVNNNFKLNN